MVIIVETNIYRNDVLILFVNATRSMFDDLSESNTMLDSQRGMCWYHEDIQ